MKTQNYPDNFVEWIRSQELTEKEEMIWSFHEWMRHETTLSSGSIVDYRKYVARYLDENGDLRNDSGLTSHEKAAVSKFKTFQDSSTTTGEGE